MKNRSILWLLILPFMFSSCAPFYPPKVTPPPIDTSLIEFSTLPPILATPNPNVKVVTQAQLSLLLPPSLAAHHKPGSMYHSISTFPKYDPNSTDAFQVDLRSADLSALDLTTNLFDILFSSYDSKTKWPGADKLPAEFDPLKVLESGKDPGLGMRFLHQKGITGRGIGIAIIDQILIVDHIEYAAQVQVYEEDHDSGNLGQWSMHGPAVASIAVGKTVGVAPEADLYFIASGLCATGGPPDFACLARDVRRVIKINKSLPAYRRIRVLSMSIGWDKSSLGYTEINAAVEEAKAAGIFVVSSSLYETYGLFFHGLGHNPLADPNDFQSYGPGSWWKRDFYDNGLPLDALLVPMDARTTASPTGLKDYVFYGEGGWSWSIPYIAATYALACQVDPGITPEKFWSTALETGQTIQVQHEGKTYSFGKILDPQALIAALQK